MAEGVVFLLIGEREAVFSPGTVEKRNHAVIEQVQKIAQDVIFPRHPFHQELGVWDRQNSERPREAHEVYGHLRLVAVPNRDLLDFAGGKCQALLLDRFVTNPDCDLLDFTGGKL